MHKSKRRLALAASAVLAITAAAGAAMAQMPPPPPPPPALPPLRPLPPLPPMDAMMMGGHDMAMRHHGKPADPEAHAKHLRDVLQLRPDQDGALKAYLEATAPKAMHEMSNDDGSDQPLTTPRRLDREAAHMTKMVEAFQKRAAATKAFYAALSPSQQKAFDAIGPHGGGPKMGHGESHKEERKIIMKPKAG